MMDTRAVSVVILLNLFVGYAHCEDIPTPAPTTTTPIPQVNLTKLANLVGLPLLGANTGCDHNSLDSTVQWLFYLQHPTRQIPENMSGLQEFCSYKDVIEGTVDAYGKRCLETLPRTLTDLLMFGVRRQNRYYCSAGTKAKTNYLGSAKCLVAIRTTGGQCMGMLIVDMLSVLSSPSCKRIGRFCCVYYRFEDCLMQTAQDKCQARDVKRVEDLLHGYTGQMISNMCMNYPKETDCAKLYPKREWNEARRLAKKRFKPLPVSILPPLIDVISSLPPNFGTAQ